MRRSNPPSLVKLEDLSGSGPAGPPGVAGPAGDDGTVDYSNIYTKQEVDTRLLFKQQLVSSTSGTGTEVWDSGMVRRLVAGSGVTLSLDANENIVVAS